MTFTGPCNRDLFELWFKDCLLQKLQAGDAIVIDNASFHHSAYIEEIVAAAGCELWYLASLLPRFVACFRRIRYRALVECT